ncbi:MAG: sucrose phosphorylase [Acidimicrobiia bacterium]|nr:sucrose phosphorylase [Acidimicrobiia bacterium]
MVVQFEPQLITYVDRLAGDFGGLLDLLEGPLAGAFGGVHLLPFYDPIDGADAGFDPVDHTAVDHRLGDWNDAAHIGANHVVMADLIVNHVSSRSPAFIDWCEHGVRSEHDGMFLTLDRVFPGGPTDAELDSIYRPRPGLPFTDYDVAGVSRRVWTTFTSDQIDIDVDHPAAWRYLLEVLDRFAGAKVDIVRLDAVGYAVKRHGTRCFMLPETFDFIRRLADECHERGMQVLVEIHSHYLTQIEIAGEVDLIYDFALPPLVLHAIYQRDARPLQRWLTVRPTNCVTVLDTHDGIGVIDVAPANGEPGLLEADDIDRLVEAIHSASRGQSRQATGAAASNVDLYQVNCAWFDALGGDDRAHLLARMIQVLVPGVPQVYYAGLLAEHNDMELIGRTGVGRDINRPYYDDHRRRAALARPVVQDTLRLLRWRSAECHLFGGDFELLACDPHQLALAWSHRGHRLEAFFDLADRSYRIELDGRSASAMHDLGSLRSDPGRSASESASA